MDYWYSHTKKLVTHSICFYLVFHAVATSINIILIDFKLYACDKHLFPHQHNVTDQRVHFTVWITYQCSFIKSTKQLHITYLSNLYVLVSIECDALMSREYNRIPHFLASMRRNIVAFSIFSFEQWAWLLRAVVESFLLPAECFTCFFRMHTVTLRDRPWHLVVLHFDF